MVDPFDQAEADLAKKKDPFDIAAEQQAVPAASKDPFDIALQNSVVSNAQKISENLGANFFDQFEIGRVIRYPQKKIGEEVTRLPASIFQQAHQKFEEETTSVRANLEQRLAANPDDTDAKINLAVVNKIGSFRKALASFFTDWHDYAQKDLEAAAKPETFAGKLVSAMGEAGFKTLEIAGVSAATGNPILAMTTLGLLEDKAAGGTGVRGAATGAVLGSVFHGTSYLPKVLSLPTNAVVFGGMTAQQKISERGSLKQLTAEDKEDILVDTLVGGMLAIPGDNPSMAQFKASLKRRGFKDAEIAKAEAKAAAVVGTPEQRQEIQSLVNELQGVKEVADRAAAEEGAAKRGRAAQQIAQRMYQDFRDERAAASSIEQFRAEVKTVGQELSASEPAPVPEVVDAARAAQPPTDAARAGVFPSEPPLAPEARIEQIAPASTQDILANLSKDIQAKWSKDMPDQDTARMASPEQMAKLGQFLLSIDPQNPLKVLQEKVITPPGEDKGLNLEGLAWGVDVYTPGRELTISEKAALMRMVDEVGSGLNRSLTPDNAKKVRDWVDLTLGKITKKELKPVKTLQERAKEITKQLDSETNIALTDKEKQLSSGEDVIEPGEEAIDLRPKPKEVPNGVLEAKGPEKAQEVVPKEEAVLPVEQHRLFIEPQQVTVRTPGKFEGEPRKVRDVEADIEKNMKAISAEYAKSEPDTAKVSALELKEQTLISELRAARSKDIKDEGLDVDAELAKELEGFDIPEEARALFEDNTNPVEVMQKTDANALSLSSASPADVRRGDIAAYRFSDGTVITGRTHSELTGQLLSRPDAAGVQMGWVDSHGDFIAESAYKTGPVENVKVTPDLTTKAIARIISKLQEQRGSWSNNPKPVELKPELIKEVLKLRDSFHEIRKAAKREKKDVETYLRDKGLSQSAIEAYKKISLLEVQTSEVVPRATREQKRVAHEIARELNVDLDSMKESLGLERKSMSKMNYDEAAKLVSYLEKMRGDKSGDEPSLDNIQQRMDAEPTVSFAEAADQISKSEHIAEKVRTIAREGGMVATSPENWMGWDPVGKKIYDITNRADVLKMKEFEYIITNLNGALVDKIAKSGSDASKRIHKALENKIDISELSKEERAVVDVLKNVFNYTIEKFASSRVVDPTRLDIIKAIAQKQKYSPHEDGDRVKSVLGEYKKEFNFSSKEMEVLEVLRSRIKYYAPHVFDRDGLKATTRKKLDELNKQENKNTALIKKLEDTLTKLEGGQLFTYNELPKEVQFAYYKHRQGAEGYQADAGLAFNVYIKGWLKKMYDEPALKASAELYTQLPAEMKPFVKKYLYDYIGWNRPIMGNVANYIKQVEWALMLGGIPYVPTTSSIGNLIGGSLNILTDKGPVTVYQGIKKAMSADGLREFKATGITREIPTVQFSGAEREISSRMEKVRSAIGTAFNMVEFGLRDVAYHTGMADAAAKGLTGEDAFWHAVDTVHRTQFRYGRTGMPIAMRGWAGVVTQFSSYPVKQMELLKKWTKEPGGYVKFLSWFAISAGLAWGSKELLGADVSNYVGLEGFTGVETDPQEIWSAIESMTNSEWESAERHMKLGFRMKQAPLLLTGPILDVVESLRSKDDKAVDNLFGQLEPNNGRKLRDLYMGLKNEQGGRYPIYSYDSQDFLGGQPVKKKYELSLKDLLMRTFIMKPSKETDYQMEELSNILTDKEIAKILTSFDRAIMRSDMDELNRLISRYPGVVAGRTADDVKNDFLNMQLTNEERRMMKLRSQDYARRKFSLENK